MNGLPSVNITFEDGNLGFLPDSTDGLIAVVLAGTAQGTVAVSTPYRIVRPEDLVELGATEATNPVLFRFVQDFYLNTPKGSPLWFMLLGVGVSVSTIYNANKALMTKLIRATNNEVTAVFVLGAVGTFANQAAYTTFVNAASAYRDEFLGTDNAPVIHVVDYLDYDSTTALTAITSAKGVGGFIGKDSTGKSSIGVLAGRYANNSVQRNVGAVADGALTVQGGEQYHDEVLVKQMDKATDVNNAGFITLRVHNAYAGFYFTDDPLLVASSSDYSSLTAQRTIDKAFRIAFKKFTMYLLADLLVNANGTIRASQAKAIENDIRSEIKRLMTDLGQLNADPNDADDAGVEVSVDTNYNTLSNRRLKLNYLRVKPFGYARTIDVPLGFVPVS